MTMLVGLVAIANLFSKRIATIWGISFTVVFFLLFTVSERINLRRLKEKKCGLEEFNLDLRPEIACEAVHARPGCVLVAVRHYSRLAHLETVLQTGRPWERLPEPRHPFSLDVISPGRPSIYVNLGPHPPRLWPEDLDRLHELWLRLSEDHFGSKLHHRDVIGAALRRLEKDLECDRRADAIEDLNRELRKD